MITTRKIALLGNPNVGKTTLFNQLTGTQQKVGNWAGVTVERKEGFFTTPTRRIILIDLPGIYSLTTMSHQSSLDEQIACRYILEGQADMLINVVDAANIEQNFYMTLQILELGIPCIVVLNMIDIARSQGIIINISLLKQQLKCPVIPLVSTSGEGLSILKAELDGPIPAIPSSIVNYPKIINKLIEQEKQFAPSYYTSQQKRWLVLHMLEGDIYSSNLLKSLQIKKNLNVIPQHDMALMIADARYATITILCQTVSNNHLTPINHFTTKLDLLLLNRWLGVPFLFIIMYLMFIVTINFGGALKPLFEGVSIAYFIHGTQWLGYYFHTPPWLTMLLTQGIGSGINTVLSLIPQISIMYLCLSFLEDSGYMARAAFVIDRLMQALGLPGKSFVPLIVGFGCNVLAVMSARTLNAPRERLMTIMMAPFMSCGARLAIFAVFAATFFNQNSVTLVFSLYILGIVVAVLTGLILKYTLMRGEAIPFIIELPVYHMPHIKSLLLQTWQRIKGFVLRASKVIIITSILINVLNNFNVYGQVTNNVNNSLLATISKTLTPLLKPIGINEENWQATIGLISGAIAKEVVIGTLNTLYTAEQITNTQFNPKTFDIIHELYVAVIDTWQSLKDVFSYNVFINPVIASKGDGEMSKNSMNIMNHKFGSAIAAYSYLIFVLLYVPCISVLGAINRESNYIWMILSFFWGINVAYSLATLFYQTATFMNHVLYSTLTISIVIIFNSLLIMTLYFYRDLLDHKLN